MFGGSLSGHEEVIVEQIEGDDQFFAQFRDKLGEGGGYFHGQCRNAGLIGGRDAEEAIVVELQMAAGEFGRWRALYKPEEEGEQESAKGGSGRRLRE